jgi:hypothetical protein
VDDAEIASIRAVLFKGLASIPAFAKANGKCNRTVHNWVRAGLPVVYRGQTPYVDVAKAGDFLNRLGQRELAKEPGIPPRRRGRPRKAGGNA